MNVYLFSIGETTTDIVKWQWERLGHKVIMLQDPKTTFYEKYLEFLNMAKHDDHLVRTDADIIPLKHVNNYLLAFMAQNQYWWATGKGWCDIRKDIIDMSINVMKHQVIQQGLVHMHEFKKDSRPETRLSRVPELMNPRRFIAASDFIGLHGYKQRPEDVARVMHQKAERKQLGDYDMELIEKLNAL